ncbi:PLU-1-like protein-domain-containing protein [Auriculariales sp. MPI-PUGE-AT-0066]|nr:PLU-1-like protein-domain-containing protein [Auriculariales sp. MPI-PUGE-AT-0066]
MSAPEATPSTPTRGTPSRRGSNRTPRSPREVRPPNSRDADQPDSAALSTTKPTSSSNTSSLTHRTADDFVRPFSTLTSALDVPTDGSPAPYDFRNPPREQDLEDRSEQPKSNVTPAVPAAAATAPAPGAAVPGPPKRAPRKSKTDAMAAIARGESPGAADKAPPATAPAADHADMPLAIERAPKLDWSLVKSESPRVLPPRTTPRAFALEECPTFYPSLEEFKDPMKYLQTIGPKAKDYGICKIVPPVGWRMPFYTDTETFRFSTRLQRLNSIEASSRAKLNFLEQLYRFHSSQGNHSVEVPNVNARRLDLWLLRKEVQRHGGYDAVIKNKKWSDICHAMSLTSNGTISAQLKSAYAKIILPFEAYSEQHRDTFMQHASTKHQESSPQTDHASLPGEDTHMADTNAPGAKMARPRKRMMAGMAPASHAEGTKEEDRMTCKSCGSTERGTEMLLCDGCDSGFHTYCLDPPLPTVPKGQWFCSKCLFGTGGDFGFDEGEEHCLQSFMLRDRTFRKMWFDAHPPKHVPTAFDEVTKTVIDDVHYAEADVENEFWRLVEEPLETVEVEYGADVHSTTHGSAMPTVETHPRDPYARDPWNVNNIPILADSLLRYIKSDISGMTVPWTYVGMIFSTFCWHNEDHYTHSINYMHWGETKTWYGIPGADAEKFEAALRKEAPDLFDAQPDLLYQLTTLMNPGRLRKAGVRVYACNQRAGEYVVTFPQAYHAGFNHGLNFNEAVNFALPDWLPLGLDCVKRYQINRKLPVFSHDELLITVTQHSHSIKTAVWVLDSLREMVDREKDERADIQQELPGIQESLEEYDTPENQYQCSFCNAFCYLAQVTCPSHTEQVSCLQHAKQLCGCDPTTRVLRKRFSDEQLDDIVAKVTERAAIPADWQAKLRRTLQESARPNLRALRALLAEGERVSFHLPELNNLRRCVTRANEWVEAATNFTTRKQVTKRTRKLPSAKPRQDVEMDDAPTRGLDDVYSLLSEVDELGFECPEIEQLRRVAQTAEEFRKKARVAIEEGSTLDERDINIDELETQITLGAGLNMRLPELDEMRDVFLRAKLARDFELLEDNNATLDDITQLIARARSAGISDNAKIMRTLLDKEAAGTEWCKFTETLLTMDKKAMTDLDKAVNVDAQVPLDLVLHERISAVRSRAKDIERQARIMLAPEKGAVLPRPSEALKLVERASKEFTIPIMEELYRCANFARELEDKCELVLTKRFVMQNDSNPLTVFHKWVAYAHTHLPYFQMNNFRLLDEQLKAHTQWVQRLPWYCNEHNAVHSDPILRDVRETTGPEEDLPPKDEAISCICENQVVPPPPGEVSDAVQCDHCFARFHGACAASGGSCPFCDHHHWNGSIHKERNWHFCFLPTMLVTAPDITKFYSTSWKELEFIVARVDRLCAAISQFLAFVAQPGNQRREYLGQVRHYMRKLFRIQFAVSPHPDVSYGLDLAGLHRRIAGSPVTIAPAARKKKKVKIHFAQDVNDKSEADGSRCLCRGEHRGAQVVCQICNRSYHELCVRYSSGTSRGIWYCPACAVKKAKPYPHAELRIKCLDSRIRTPEDSNPNIFIDITSVGDPNGQLRRMKMGPATRECITLELVGYAVTSETVPAPIPRPSIPPPPPPPHYGYSLPPPHLAYSMPMSAAPTAPRKRKLSEAEEAASRAHSTQSHGLSARPPDAEGQPPMRKVKLLVKAPEGRRVPPPSTDVIDLT